MNANAVARNYTCLTAEERFRLILAASGRGDEAERDRLMNAGGRIALSMSDHAPYGFAFNELALLVFVELLEEAACYLDGLARADDTRDVFDDDAEADDVEPMADVPTAAKRPNDDTGKRPLWQRTLDLALAVGYVLRTKADGWNLFCERLAVPPFLLWEGLPGIDRLRRALALAEKAAFTSEGFLRWWNDVRRPGEPTRTEVSLTVEAVADETAKMFRDRAEWWAGD